MNRSLSSALLVLATLAATAQTAPHATKKTTTPRPIMRRNPRHPAPGAAKSTPAVAPRPTTAAPADGSFGNGATGSSANADGKGQGVYAAPGMAVDVTPSKEVGSYKGTAEKAAPKPASTGTTLSPK